MEALICLPLDADAEEGGKVATAYGIGALPTLLFLEPDGTVRDLIVGYQAPLPFQREVARILRDEGTFTGLRARIAADANDLMARYELSKKLTLIGDLDGSQAELDEVRARDPEGSSLAGQWLAFDALLAALEIVDVPDPQPFRELLARVTDASLLQRGWSRIQLIHLFLATDTEDVELRAAELQRSTEAAGKALAQCPPAEQATFATELATSYWDQRKQLDERTRRFALELARRATELAPEQVGIRDVFACCLFMNGRSEEAAKQALRCIEQDPDNPRWPARLAEFEAGD